MTYGTHNKQSTKFTENKRIEHIKEKKERIRQEQIEREEERLKGLSINLKNPDDIEIDENFGKKNKKRSKKKKHEISDSD